MAAMKVRMLHPPLDLICHIQVGRQLVLWKRERQAGLAESSGHQLGSETAILSLASCFLVEIPFKGGLRPQKGAKVLRNRETITFTR